MKVFTHQPVNDIDFIMYDRLMYGIDLFIRVKNYLDIELKC